MSPADVSFLLKCHVYPEVWESEHKTLDVVKPWLDAGIIERHEPFGASFASGQAFRTTKRGDAWVKAICGVPMPTPAFLDESGRVL